MSTTVVGQRPAPHRPFRGLVQVGYTPPSRATPPSTPVESKTREEALLATSVNGCITGVSHVKPFFLPPRGQGEGNHGSVEKGLGYGAFGVVWSVIDPRDGQKVALKRIPRVFHNPITAKRVHRELKMLSCLKHENIVNLIDVVKSESYLNFEEIYFLFELMQTDLHKIIVSPQPLSLDHVKIFVYQILRGLKYLHSARIIHRDIKPGNMLVNSNCLLKICDFGLARIDDPFGEAVLTQEVVTQYYRSPELLMEATRYSYAVDIWSVGCTFAELLGRRILFPARSPLEQLELIINLTGSPSPGDLESCHPDACCFVLSSRLRDPNLSILYALTPDVNELTVHLLGSMLKFNPRQRISAADALNHPFLEEARLRYHSCMCSCCHDISSTSGNDGVQTSGFCCAPSPSASSSCASSSTPSSDSMQSGNGKCLISRYEAKTAANAVPSSGSSNNHSTFCSTGGTARRRYFHDLDPICSVLLPFDLDSGFRRLSDAKRVLWDSIQEYYRRDDRLTRVVLNRNAANYSNFIK
ncbi:Serine/threonine-protein kinase NLK2 isoform 1 [Schistosoma japonicum]|uniref:Mitogen-activated protein kinase n=1 Tax=Schistosoma japonicum TaxID=6182 RepID=A0A4Z2CSH0_SCHJA|nr:Serine/threonine-protein kinase NLK2 isoform 1 [Schistosoma japonicum]